MPFYVLKGDLVKMNVDVIVNAANVKLVMLEGVGRAIFHKAGDKELQKACSAYHFVNVGEVVSTPSFNMTNCKAIYHAVGPNYINGKHGEEKNLTKAYLNSLNMLVKDGYTSIAFPLLSGEFNYPLDEAYAIASKTILKFLENNPNIFVYLVMYKNFPEILDDNIQDELTRFITSNYKISLDSPKEKLALTNTKFVNQIKKIIKEKGIEESLLAYHANISADCYTKLMNDSTFIPSKNICLCLAVKLNLTKEETNDLLSLLGYELVNSNILDLIVSFYLEKNIYDIFKINDALFIYKIYPLGE